MSGGRRDALAPSRKVLSLMPNRARRRSHAPLELLLLVLLQFVVRARRACAPRPALGQPLDVPPPTCRSRRTARGAASLGTDAAPLPLRCRLHRRAARCAPVRSLQPPSQEPPYKTPRPAKKMRLSICGASARELRVRLRALRPAAGLPRVPPWLRSPRGRATAGGRGPPARAKLRKHTKRKRSRRSRRHTKRHTKRPPQRLASLALRWRHTHACVIFESVSALRFPRARALGANARLVHAWQGTLFWAASLLLRVVLEQVGGEELDRVGRPVRCKIRSVRSVRCQVSGVRCECTVVSDTYQVSRLGFGLGGSRVRASVYTRVCVQGSWVGRGSGVRVRGQGEVGSVGE